MLQSLTELYLRDLENVIKDLNAYENEADIWKVDGQITNPAGNLALHIAGNLLHYVGAVLGGSSYVRDRPAEFASKNIPRADLIKQLELTKSEISRVLPNIPESGLKEPYPNGPFEMTIEMFMLHLHGHLEYHAGQINYHRRLLAV